MVGETQKGANGILVDDLIPAGPLELRLSLFRQQATYATVEITLAYDVRWPARYRLRVLLGFGVYRPVVVRRAVEFSSGLVCGAEKTGNFPVPHVVVEGVPFHFSHRLHAHAGTVLLVSFPACHAIPDHCYTAAFEKLRAGLLTASAGNRGRLAARSCA
jgi:hypothetical protein